MVNGLRGRESQTLLVEVSEARASEEATAVPPPPRRRDGTAALWTVKATGCADSPLGDAQGDFGQTSEIGSLQRETDRVDGRRLIYLDKTTPQRPSPLTRALEAV